MVKTPFHCGSPNTVGAQSDSGHVAISFLTVLCLARVRLELGDGAQRGGVLGTQLHHTPNSTGAQYCSSVPFLSRQLAVRNTQNSNQTPPLCAHRCGILLPWHPLPCQLRHASSTSDVGIAIQCPGIPDFSTLEPAHRSVIGKERERERERQRDRERAMVGSH